MQLLNTLIAPDGARRLCLFRREDGLFQYRFDRLIIDDEDFEPYWRNGYPLSGLFESTDEALKSANDENGPLDQWRSSPSDK